MGWGQETMARRASLASLDDLLEAVDAYLDDGSSENFSRVVVARDKAKASKARASTRVDL
jgi:hypothetical protein